jgi:hypothetical protein
MRYLNPTRTRATYESDGGDHAFVHWAIETVQPEVPGFSSAITTRHIDEAVFVAAEDAPWVELFLSGVPDDVSTTELLTTSGIAFRNPTGTPLATVTPLVSARSIGPVSDVA